MSTSAVRADARARDSNRRYRWRCSACGSVYEDEDVRYTCPSCGPGGLLDALPDYERVRDALQADAIAFRDERSIWRYLPLLPLRADPGLRAWLDRSGPLATVGWTPLVEAVRLGDLLGLSHVYVKDDGRNPTGSLKDRASAVVVADAWQRGERTVATASSGNAAAALAGMCAATGMSCVIFVPRDAPEAKIAQLLVYGATVLLVEGSYDDAYDLCIAACDDQGWYCRNTGYNPRTTEGKRTCALEIVQQLAWRAPAAVVVPVGDGNIITGLHRGFQDARALGWSASVPRLFGVQAAGAAALYHAWQRGDEAPVREPAVTIADSIGVGLPRDGRRALRAMRETGGACLAVEDTEILEATTLVGRQTGVFVEPAAAAAFAGLIALARQGAFAPGEEVVVVATGNGLKDVRSASRAAGPPRHVHPDLDTVRAVVRDLHLS